MALNPIKHGGTLEVTHSLRDLGICQVLEVLPTVRARPHLPILGLHPHLGDQVELQVSLQGLYLHIIVIIC